ncbi:MAG: CotH kinase family protein [Bacteroidetes bacterium]|nr:CotH kinase family protein [Bacteroidota bacterium]
MKQILLGLLFMASLRSTAQTSVAGNNLFDETYVHEIRLTMNQPNFWDSLTMYYDSSLAGVWPKTYMLASAVIDGTNYDSVGLRQKGFFSNWGAGTSVKKPLKLSMNEYVRGQKHDGEKKINLQNCFEDPSMMRDAISYKIMRDAGIVAPRASYTRLYINNVYWGLYVMVEEMDKTFFDRNYSSDNGNHYECINNTNLDWQGPNWQAYSDEFELKTNTATPDYSDFIRFVNVVNNFPNRDSLNAVLEAENYMRVLAADVLLLNWDSYYNHGRNFNLYNDPDNNKFNWIPWDYNLALSDRSQSLIISYNSPFDEPKPLVLAVMNDDTLRKHYLLHACDLLETVFNTTYLGPWIDSTYNRIRPAVLNDTNAFFTVAEFDQNVYNTTTVTINDPIWGPYTQTYPGVRSFIAMRTTQVRVQLQQQGVYCDPLSVQTPEVAALRLYPNPAGEQITLDYSAGFGNDTRIELYNSNGQFCGNWQPAAGTTQMQISLHELPAGLYLLKLNDAEGNQFVYRLIHQ